jgi:hypothetical protein
MVDAAGTTNYTDNPMAERPVIGRKRFEGDRLPVFYKAENELAGLDRFL